MSKLVLLVALLLACASTCFSQVPSDSISSAVDLPARFMQKVNNRVTALEQKIASKSVRALERFSRQEEKLARKLDKIDTVAGSKLRHSAKAQYAELKALLAGDTKINVTGKYVPYVDTLKTALSFLSTKFAGPASTFTSVSKIDQLQNRFRQTDIITKFIKERRTQLFEQLKPFKLTSSLGKYNKHVYYYSQQIKEYQDIIKHPKKIERKAVDVLTKLPAFQKFLQKHSELASLFPAPDNMGSPVILQGLQSRSSIQQLVQEQIGTATPNVEQLLQRNIQQSRTILDELKQEAEKLASSSGDFETPDFRPNNQKKKSFFKRLEFGTNVQSTKANTYFPVTSDIGVSIGYKITDNGVLGIGGSYKVGLGSDIRNIKLSHQGVSLRSFIDWKIKGSFFLSGGYEQNYRDDIQRLQQLKQHDRWQQSGLVGISKVLSLKTKVFKQTKMQLLWDFLSHQPNSTEQFFKFRIGYNF